MKLSKSLLVSLILGVATLPALFSYSAIAGNFRRKSLKVGGILYVNDYVPYKIKGTKYMLLLQGDGNLVFYNQNAFFGGDGANAALWSSGTMPDIKLITYRHGKIIFYNNKNNSVRNIDIGYGSQVCISNKFFKPVGCK